MNNDWYSLCTNWREKVLRRSPRKPENPSTLCFRENDMPFFSSENGFKNFITICNNSKRNLYETSVGTQDSQDDRRCCGSDRCPWLHHHAIVECTHPRSLSRPDAKFLAGNRPSDSLPHSSSWLGAVAIWKWVAARPVAAPARSKAG